MKKEVKRILAILLVLALMLPLIPHTEAVYVCKHLSSSWVTVKKPTCVSTGLQQKKCNNCQTVLQTKTLPKTNRHTPGSFVTVYAATCTRAGKRVQRCTVCNTVLDEQEIAKLGHVYINTNWLWVYHPTCLHEGLQQQECQRDCGTIGTRTVACLDHVFSDDDWTTVVQPTCTTKGEQHRYCQRGCGTREVRTLPMKQHVYMPANCMTEEKCFFCGDVAGPKTGHKLNEKTGLCDWCGQAVSITDYTDLINDMEPLIGGLAQLFIYDQMSNDQTYTAYVRDGQLLGVYDGPNGFSAINALLAKHPEAFSDKEFVFQPQVVNYELSYVTCQLMTSVRVKPSVDHYTQTGDPVYHWDVYKVTTEYNLLKSSYQYSVTMHTDYVYRVTASAFDEYAGTETCALKVERCPRQIKPELIITADEESDLYFRELKESWDVPNITAVKVIKNLIKITGDVAACVAAIEGLIVFCDTGNPAALIAAVPGLAQVEIDALLDYLDPDPDMVSKPKPIDYTDGGKTPGVKATNFVLDYDWQYLNYDEDELRLEFKLSNSNEPLDESLINFYYTYDFAD